jgi:hypothetical protein
VDSQLSSSIHVLHVPTLITGKDIDNLTNIKTFIFGDTSSLWPKTTEMTDKAEAIKLQKMVPGLLIILSELQVASPRSCSSRDFKLL